jgi:prevent-host-death family protein
MKAATITEVKNGLSALLDAVRGGETIVVTDRGIPIARIEPIGAGVPAGRVQRLHRAGVLAPASAADAVERIRRPAPRLGGGASAVAAVLDERRSGR